MTQLESSVENHLYFLIQIVAHRLKKRSDAVLLSEVQLTTAQSAVMLLIAKEQPVTQNYLAKKLGQNESAITGMVNRLITRGYVNKKPSSEDSRARQLSVTDNGTRALEEARVPFSKIDQLLERALTLQGIENMSRQLEGILRELD